MNSASLEIRPVSKLIVRELGLAELRGAAQLLGRGMCDNPIDVRVFPISSRHERSQALARLFAPVLRGLYQRGAILGAFHDNSLAGVCGMASPGACQPGLLEKIRAVPAVLFGNPLGTLPRVLTWAAAWARRDPLEPHWHLGPVAVDPQLQRLGIGTAMLAAFCSYVDICAALSYLETDKYENVRFYQKFGFKVVGETEVIGAPNWFMLRRPSLQA
jgi:ribosomal protein S18 acetylase RimI-like enzyme